MSVSSKFHTSYNVVIIFMYVVVSNVTDDLDDVFSCDSSSISRNVSLLAGLSVGRSVGLSTTSFIAVLCCW